MYVDHADAVRGFLEDVVAAAGRSAAALPTTAGGLWKLILDEASSQGLDLSRLAAPWYGPYADVEWSQKDGTRTKVSDLASSHQMNILALLWRTREAGAFHEDLVWMDLAPEEAGFSSDDPDVWWAEKPVVKACKHYLGLPANWTPAHSRLG